MTREEARKHCEEKYCGYSKEVYEYLTQDLRTNKEWNIACALKDCSIMPYRDGNKWCILIGEDLQSGICGFGDLIYDAFIDFMKNVQTNLLK